MNAARHRRYLKYYDEPSLAAPFRFLVDSIFAGSRAEKMSLLNRQRDYIRIRDSLELLTLHGHINGVLAEAAEKWKSYDYGEGYHYQSFPKVAVSGLRDTAGRVAQMGLPELVSGKSVLEIGCNSGFIGLSLADAAEEIVGFDINPFMVAIAKGLQEHLELENLRFEVARFEDWEEPATYDVLLSFANHSTYDGNTEQDVEQYFDRCLKLTSPGGRLLFESHTPAHEGEGLEGVVDAIGRRFTIVDRRVLDYGSYLDRGRTFVIADR